MGLIARSGEKKCLRVGRARPYQASTKRRGDPAHNTVSAKNTSVLPCHSSCFLGVSLKGKPFWSQYCCVPHIIRPGPSLSPHLLSTLNANRSIYANFTKKGGITLTALTSERGGHAQLCYRCPRAGVGVENVSRPTTRFETRSKPVGVSV